MMRIPSPALLLPLALLLAASCSSDPEVQVDPEAQLAVYRETALFHYENDDILRAEGQAVRGLDIDPSDKQLRLLFAWINLRKGTTRDLLVAKGVFEELEPEGDYRALLGLAEVRERLGMVYAESADSIEAGLSFTEAADPVERAGELRRQAQDSWTSSYETYRRTLEKKPDDLKTLNGLQRVTALLDRYEESLEWSARLLEITDAELSFWNEQLQYGDLNLRQEQRLRERQRTTRQLQVATHLYASDVSNQLARREEALFHLDRVLEVDPQLAEAHSRRAQLLYRMGDYDDALDAVHEFLRSSRLPYDHPDVRRAYDLLTDCERAAEAQAIESGVPR